MPQSRLTDESPVGVTSSNVQAHLQTGGAPSPLPWRQQGRAFPPRLSSVPLVIVYSVVDEALSPDFPLGVDLDVFIRREDAERFIEEVRSDDPEVAAKLRIEERELEAGG